MFGIGTFLKKTVAPLVFGPVGQSALAYMGQKDANQKNLEIAREQMAFQERMSNTAVSRRMEDLRSSGINPILAGQFDASTPAGALATMGNVGAAGAAGLQAGAAASSARESAKRTKLLADQELKNLQMQETLLREQAGSARASKNLQDRQREKVYVDMRKEYGLTPKGEAEVELLEAQVPQTQSQTRLNDAQFGKLSKLAEAYDVVGAVGAGVKEFGGPIGTIAAAFFGGSVAARKLLEKGLGSGKLKRLFSDLKKMFGKDAKGRPPEDGKKIPFGHYETQDRFKHMTPEERQYERMMYERIQRGLRE